MMRGIVPRSGGVLRFGLALPVMIYEIINRWQNSAKKRRRYVTRHSHAR